MPFIDMLKVKANILELRTIDYRLLNAIGANTYFYPLVEETGFRMNDVWQQMTGHATSERKVITVAQGRTLASNKCLGNVAEFSF